MTDEDRSSRGEGMETEETPETKIRVSFVLASTVKDRKLLELPTEPIAVPASIRKKGLSAVVNHLLDRVGADVDEDDDKSSDESDEGDESSNNGKLPAIPFDFLLNDKLLRMPLDSAARKEGLSTEHALILQYFPARLQPREEGESERLPDWISVMDYTSFGSFGCSDGISGHLGVLFTGGCDGIVRTFSQMDTEEKGGLKPAGSIAAHTGPIKCLSSILLDQTGSGSIQNKNRSSYSGNLKMLVATGSMDQTVVTHAYNHHKGGKRSLSLHAVYSGGHSNSINSVSIFAASSSSSLSSSQKVIMASADWDGGLAIWQVPTNDHDNDHDNADKTPQKRHKLNGAGAKPSLNELVVNEVKPLKSIRAHNSNISGIAWGCHQPSSTTSNIPTTLLTGSWDHSLKAWDIERSDCILSLNGSRVITALDRCSNSDVVATAHPDWGVRLWDMRTNVAGGVGGSKQSSQVMDRSLRQR